MKGPQVLSLKGESAPSAGSDSGSPPPGRRPRRCRSDRAASRSSRGGVS